MADSRKNHLNIDGGQIKEDEHTVSCYKPIPESDTDFRSSKTSVHKSKEKVSADGAEEKLLDKEEEAKIIRVDMADAKYVVGDHRNGDAKIELDANKKQFSGLTKEELLKYAEDPFWVRLRWAMFVLFWVLWLAMLAAAIAIIVQAPKCALPTPRTWYEKGPHVDMSSMQSYSEIEGKLSELKESNVAGIFTYVCKDAYEVLEEKPGCITQFKEFVVQAQKYGIKVIVDLVANYVPDTHRWFQLSENRSADYDTFFTWAKGKDFESDSTKQNPPNGWVSTLNEPAWKWSESRQEYYLHQFAEDQPDLNFHNPKVVEKFDAVIKAWMDAGADGIRLRHARELLVDSSLAEEVQDSGAVGADHSQYRYWQHRRTADRPELDALLAHWAHLARATGEKVFTIMETEARTELYLLDRNTSYLRPPSARPVRAAATAAGDISARVKRWPLMQLVDGDDDAELAVFSMLLPAAPVLSSQQLPVKDNNTDASTKFAHASSLRADHVIAHGRSEVAAVSATTSDAQADQLLACARWMEGHLCYLGLYNPGLAPARANLTALPMLPPTLKVHYTSTAVKHNTNYTSTTVVPIDNVLVPSKSSVVFSFNYKSTVET